MKKKLIKKYQSGGSPRLYNYLPLPPKDKWNGVTSIKDLEGNELSPGDLVMATPEGKMVTPDNTLAYLDYMAANNIPILGPTLNQITVTHNNLTGKTTTSLGEDFEDRLKRLLLDPIANDSLLKLLWLELGELLWNLSHDKHVIDTRAADKVANARTPEALSIMSPALIGIAAILGFESATAMAAWAAAYPEAFTGIVGSTLGGEIINLATNLGSGGKYRDWGDAANLIWGTGETLGGFTNPGYFINPLSRGTSPIEQNGKRLLDYTLSQLKGSWALRALNTANKYNLGEGVKTGIYNVDLINKHINKYIKKLQKNPYLFTKARMNIEDRARDIIHQLNESPHHIQVLTPYGSGSFFVELPWSTDVRSTVKPLSKIYLNLSSDNSNVLNIPMLGGFKLSTVPKSERGMFSMHTAVPDKVTYDIFDEMGELGNATITTPLSVRNILGTTNSEIKTSLHMPNRFRWAALPQKFDFARIPVVLDNKGNAIINPNSFIAYSTDWTHRGKVTGVPDWKPLSPEHPISKAAKEYVTYLENKLISPINGKPLATVEGSYRAVAEGLPHSPNDVELLMPESHIPLVANKFNVRSIDKNSNGFAHQVYASEFDALPKGHADFLIIRNGPNGKAIGNTAWQIYEKLHPEEALNIMNVYRQSSTALPRTLPAKPDVEAVELPISAEELFDEYINSGFYKKKWIYDTNVSKKEHHLLRSPIITQMYPEEIPNIIHKVFYGAKTLKDLNYNIDYTNVEANKVFCDYFNLPYRYAEDPKLMEAAVEKNINALLTTTRGSNSSIPFGGNLEFINKPLAEREEMLLTTTNANPGMLGMGPGGNSTNQIGKISRQDGMSREIQIIKLLNLDDPKNIDLYKTPADIIKRLKNIKDISRNSESEFKKVNSFNPKDVYRTRELAKKLGLTFWSKFEDYQNKGQYIGWVIPEDVAHLMRYVGDSSFGYEPMNIILPINSQGENKWPMAKETIEKLTESILDAVHNNPELTTLFNRFDKAISIRDKMYNIHNQKLLAGKYAFLTSMLGGLGVFGRAVYKGMKAGDSIENDLDLKYELDNVMWLNKQIKNINSLTLLDLKNDASLFLNVDISKIDESSKEEIKNKLLEYYKSEIKNRLYEIDMYERKTAAKRRKRKSK